MSIWDFLVFAVGPHSTDPCVSNTPVWRASHEFIEPEVEQHVANWQAVNQAVIDGIIDCAAVRAFWDMFGFWEGIEPAWTGDNNTVWLPRGESVSMPVPLFSGYPPCTIVPTNPRLWRAARNNAPGILLGSFEREFNRVDVVPTCTQTDTDTLDYSPYGYTPGQVRIGVNATGSDTDATMTVPAIASQRIVSCAYDSDALFNFLISSCSVVPPGPSEKPLGGFDYPSEENPAVPRQSVPPFETRMSFQNWCRAVPGVTLTKRPK